MAIDCCIPSSAKIPHCPSPVRLPPLPRPRDRRWFDSHLFTALLLAAALLLATSAWLSLVFSGTAAPCFHRRSFPDGLPTTAIRKPPPQLAGFPLLGSLNGSRGGEDRLSLEHLVFGIAGSSQLWDRRKEFLRLWWRPNEMRGHVWLEEKLAVVESDESLPPIMVSEDTSRFRYTNPTGHPSGLRISRILAETFRLGLPDVRWFVLGDDDTIFNPSNLVAVLSKYDSSEMVYIGSPSESHSANSYFSHSMAFGGGGIAISRPLAEALSNILDECIDRYHESYGSDDRLHACISELGIPLSREHGFHQVFDIRGNAHGLLSTHPIAPFVSIHHVEAVDPFYPGLTTLDSLRLFTKAMSLDPASFLQRSICYDHVHRLSFVVSLGYVVQVYPGIVLPRVLERSEKTYAAWNGVSKRDEFDVDTRDTFKSSCKRPVFFFLKDAVKQNNDTLGTYQRAKINDDLKRRVFCFPQSPPIPHVASIRVLARPLRKNWHLVPRRLCCRLNHTSNELLTIVVAECGKGSRGSVTDST
ncbi:B3glct [Linum perenne]